MNVEDHSSFRCGKTAEIAQMRITACLHTETRGGRAGEVDRHVEPVPRKKVNADGSMRPCRTGINSGIRPAFASSINSMGSGRSGVAVQTACELRGHSFRMASPRAINSARGGHVVNVSGFSTLGAICVSSIQSSSRLDKPLLNHDVSSFTIGPRSSQ